MGGRAAIYARFSSHNQRGESIEIQVEKSRAYCAENDLRVVAAYCADVHQHRPRRVPANDGRRQARTVRFRGHI